MDCSFPGSSVHGIFQVRTLERVVISYSRGSFWPRDRTSFSCIGMQILHHCATWLFQNSYFQPRPTSQLVGETLSKLIYATASLMAPLRHLIDISILTCSKLSSWVILPKSATYISSQPYISINDNSIPPTGLIKIPGVVLDINLFLIPFLSPPWPTNQQILVTTLLKYILHLTISSLVLGLLLLFSNCFPGFHPCDGLPHTVVKVTLSKLRLGHDIPLPIILMTSWLIQNKRQNFSSFIPNWYGPWLPRDSLLSHSSSLSVQCLRVALQTCQALPQGLCTCCHLCLAYSSPRLPCELLPHFVFRSLFRENSVTTLSEIIVPDPNALIAPSSYLNFWSISSIWKLC